MVRLIVKYLFFSALFLPEISAAQNSNIFSSKRNGIQFYLDNNWSEIVMRAKRENKYIFVDCYTTWCAPCREMEKNVYTLENVGMAFNEHFVSVKMQMDTAKNDNDTVKALYLDAHNLKVKHNVDGFPTFLFFTPDGKILNRSTGMKTAEDFIALAKETTDPSKNYYAVLQLFQQGKTDASQISWLARQAMRLGDTASSKNIAATYVLHLNNDSLFTRPNIEFMHEFTSNTQDKGFRLFYEQGKKVDSVIDDDTYAEGLVQKIISQEMVKPLLQRAEETAIVPDWEQLRSEILLKYNQYYAERIVTAYKSSWALHHNDIRSYTHYLVLYVDKYGTKKNTGLLASLSLNNYAWQIFQDSNDRDELVRALSWSSRAVMMYPIGNWMDTYSNILYKLGRKPEALMWEGVAAKTEPDNKEFQVTLEKMNKDELARLAN